jgi:hypothetical protein
MARPENPETIVIKNKYYPKGLREIDIWNYYQRVKPMILQETKNRDIMFMIMVDVNKPIIRKKLGDKTIRLTPQNYDKIITGRTVSIYSTMTSTEEFGIIDIDIGPTEGIRYANKAAYDVYNFVMDHVPIVRSASIRFTGKTSFHIICDFQRKMKIDVVRFLLRKFLADSELSKVYTVQAKRGAGVPNLDLAPNKFRGNYITLHSLSILGLMCMTVPYNQILRFNPMSARIK